MPAGGGRGEPGTRKHGAPRFPTDVLRGYKQGQQVCRQSWKWRESEFFVIALKSHLASPCFPRDKSLSLRTDACDSVHVTLPLRLASGTDFFGCFAIS